MHAKPSSIACPYYHHLHRHQVPFQHRCIRCNHPIYKVKMDDGLDTIAHNIFNRFITYKDVTMANKISNPNKIEVRQKLWISLSYNCNPMDGATMVRYDHMVVARSLVKRIVVEFGMNKDKSDQGRSRR
ncbi:chitin elicitor-binding protein-like [Elaeis guineensis]|uniref:chitin elicitor-binding protein-like n=1 Tax=Elaeis guineensis var. tenera TaxID=51953 RepID=UPI003C6D466F